MIKTGKTDQNFDQYCLTIALGAEAIQNLIVMAKQKSFLVIACPEWFSFKFEIECPGCKKKFCGDWEFKSVMEKTDQNDFFIDHCCHCNSKLIFSFPFIDWESVKKYSQKNIKSDDPVIIVRHFDISDTKGLIDEIEKELGE